MTEYDQDMERFRAMLEDLPLDRLAMLGDEAATLTQYYARRRALCDGEAMRRLGDTDLVAGRWGSIERTFTNEYQWEIDLLKGSVEPLLSPEDWAAVYSVEPPKPAPPPVEKINTVKLKALAKKAGIDLGPFHKVEKKSPKVVYKVSPGVEA